MEAELASVREVAATEKADRDASTEEARANASRARLTALDKDLKRARSLLDTYADLLPAEGAPTLSPGTDEEAGSLLEDADNGLRTARRATTELDQRRAHATAQVRAWLDDTRFETLRHALARQFGRLAEAELEQRAGELRGQLDLRVRALEAQVAAADRHREVLVGELTDLADAGLVVLRNAENWSRLPDTVAGFGGRAFLRIHHEAPDDPAERRARLAEFLDLLVKDGGELPGGTTLIQKVVRKLIHPVRVKVLFPDPTSTEPPMDIAEVARFSGGEQLTCAILLYCTLAQMRARRSGRRRRSGVLVLDNPIGRASRPRFLELQREVARAMNVQLLYTTGVNDHEALRALPNRIRLKNDRSDRTRGHHVVEPDEGEVLAARFQRREAAPETADDLG